MKKLIIHIKYPDDSQEGDLTLDLDDVLDAVKLKVGEGMDWSYFRSLKAAVEWEEKGQVVTNCHERVSG